MARLVGKDNNFPLVAGAKTTDALSLSPIGNVAYQVAKAISLGTPECTRSYEEKIKQVVKGETTQDVVFTEFTRVMGDDVKTIEGLSFDLKGLGFTPITKKVEGVWNGAKVKIPESANGYTFTQEELNTLFSGGTVTFTGKDFNGNPMTTSVKLGYQNYNGRPYVGLLDARYCYGVWNGSEIKFKRSFMGYAFTDEECDRLLAGESISFTGNGKDGPMTLSGKLERQKAPNGAEYVGIKAQFPLREGYVRGTFKGETVTIKGSWSDHTFTDDELKRLFAGETIAINYTQKSGKEDNVNGKLEWQTYQGKRFLGFKAQFEKRKTNKK